MALADELAYRATHLHRLMHRTADHLVNGTTRSHIKHDDTKEPALRNLSIASPLNRAEQVD
jgi:hypothetical protein